jgi:hypothetical protein
MVNLIFLLVFISMSCVNTATIAPPPTPISTPKTSSLQSELNQHVLQAYIIESKKGDFEDATTEWNKAITYSYCNPEIHLAYGDMAYRYNEESIAIEQWERAILCIGWKDQEKRQLIQQKITELQK